MILHSTVFKRHIGVQSPQLGVPGFQLLGPLQLPRAQAAVLGFPLVIASRTDAVLAADLFHRQARLCLVQDRYDLGFRESGSFYGTPPHWLIVPKFHLGVVYLVRKLT